MKMTGAQIVAEVLLDHGVDTVFGYPGGTILDVYDQLYKYSDKIHHVLTAHEQGATHAADGYARATGKTGVCFVTSGPGATNTVTGIATAFMDSIPIVVITTNVQDPLIGRDAFQEIYITGVTEPITKRNYFVNSIDKLEETLRDAFRVAGSGRKGPVLIDITKDVHTQTIEFTNKPPYPLQPLPKIKDEDVEEICALVNEAKRPVAYLGGGCVASDAADEIKEFLKKAQIPAVESLMATSTLRYDDPLNLGLVGMHGGVAANRAVHEADLIIALGARFSDRVAQDTNKWGADAKIVQIDIDKSEIGKNVPIVKSAVGDVKDFLQKALPLTNEASHEEWVARLDELKNNQKIIRAAKDMMHPKDIMDAISNKVDDETIFVTDVGQHQIWATQYLHHKKPHKFLTSGGLGTMGYGYGASIGAQFGQPDKRVIHITGDASFHMNLNEACTAVSNNLPIITVIVNNKVLGMVYQWQKLLYGRRFSNTTPERKTDFVKLAQAFGAEGFRANTVDELNEALDKAMKINGPVWIECLIDREERVLPMIPGGKTIKDIIVD